MKNFKFLNLNIKFTFRHQWDSYNTPHSYTTSREFRTKKLGIFFKKDICLHIVKDNLSTQKQFYNSIVFGINLIWVKYWVEINKNKYN